MSKRKFGPAAVLVGLGVAAVTVASCGDPDDATVTGTAADHSASSSTTAATLLEPCLAARDLGESWKGSDGDGPDAATTDPTAAAQSLAELLDKIGRAAVAQRDATDRLAGAVRGELMLDVRQLAEDQTSLNGFAAEECGFKIWEL
ncbi:MAG: hypothetical protein GY788_11685 [bacterium]|nr:hypothetical protein [bacterium]